MIELTNKNIDKLSVAIIKQAVNDYIENRKLWFVADRLGGNPDLYRKHIWEKYVELMSFFGGQYFAEMSKLDNIGSFIAKIDGEVEKWRTNAYEVNEFIRRHRSKKTES